MFESLLEMGKFRTVVIDPPWPLKSTGLVHHEVHGHRSLPYNTMPMAEIKAMPIATISDENSMIFCWTINKFLPDTYTLIKEWGFKYTFTMVWVKGGGMQLPKAPCMNAEYIVVGKKGQSKFVEIKAFSVANNWPRREHSEKPEEFYDLLRRVTNEPRIDIFNRRPIPGFQSWGNEAVFACLDPSYQSVLL